jgi:hypothetical protein
VVQTFFTFTQAIYFEISVSIKLNARERQGQRVDVNSEDNPWSSDGLHPAIAGQVEELESFSSCSLPQGPAQRSNKPKKYKKENISH